MRSGDLVAAFSVAKNKALEGMTRTEIHCVQNGIQVGHGDVA